MPILHTFTLRDPSQAVSLVSFLKEHAGPMAKAGTPLRVMVSKKLALRSLDKNALMWVLLEQVAQQVCVRGRWFDAETWHEWFKRECLPDECAKGVAKWSHHADGSRSLQMGTADLDCDEFDAYLLAFQAYAATEYGVEFRDRETANERHP